MSYGNLEKEIFGESLKDMREVNAINTKMKILTRQESKIKRVVFHCTDADGWTPERLNRFFLEERKFPTCGYHFYVQKDVIFQMVSANVVSYHAGGHNSDSISFSIDFPAGQYEKLKIKCPDEVYQQAVKVAGYLCLKYKVPPAPDLLVGHRELLGSGFVFINSDHTKRQLMKTCPGLTIDLDVFRKDVVKFIQSHLGLLRDGILGPKTMKAFTEYAVN